MKNFMCHEVFDYIPKRKVNFLTGVNGSGKSAVMSALIFGLGGGSKITNRGSANKNLIRTGQGQASVEISLYNRGETAYRSVSFFFAIYYLCYLIRPNLIKFSFTNTYYLPFRRCIFSRLYFLIDK